MELNKDSLCIAYIIVGSEDEAKDISRILIKNRLAACINLQFNLKSLYMWEEEIREDTEVLILAKTRKELMPKLIETVIAKHTYECPCILEIPIQNGNPLFIKWINQETV